MSNNKEIKTNVIVPHVKVENIEDDGFFSDVPNTGSLSKSQRAMNKFVKSNLLYEDTEEDDCKIDSAYFSKESTPNSSVTRDSESVNSDKSLPKTTIESDIRESTPNQKDLNDLKPIAESSIIDSTPNKNDTDDLKFLHNSSECDNVKRKNIVKFMDDLAIDTRVGSKTVPRVLFRDKSKKDSHDPDYRNSIHDVPSVSNRTTTYPDVYAPLPYKSPRRYVESDVNIHYKCPVRLDPLPMVPERELAQQQAEHMKKLYREQKRTKYLQDLNVEPMDVEAFDASIKELQDMQSRRHQDNFTPSQKSILPLNRYDDADKSVARALFTFTGQTPRELSFRKGDVINVRRQVDANWYEGELHGRIGLFPYNYVEIHTGDYATIKKQQLIEGRARAKFDFTAQTNLELPLKKGEVVVLTRRVDHNWWEGRIGNRTGIFPDSYVQVLQQPSQKNVLEGETAKGAASPAAHGVVGGSARDSMGAHHYAPRHNPPALSHSPQPTQPLHTGYIAQPAQASLKPSDRGYGPPTTPGNDLNNTEPLYIDTNAEAVPYRALYAYRPQHADELELRAGDTVYVVERCDDGWLVGSSQRSGRAGTFPGNYVERI